MRWFCRFLFAVFLAALFSCRMGGDIEEFIENGLTTVSVEDVSFSIGGATLQCVPSVRTVTVSLSVLNPSAVKVRYTVSWDGAYDGLFAKRPTDRDASAKGIQVAETNAGTVRFSFVLAPEAELKTIPIKIDVDAPSIDRSYKSATASLICDSPPDAPDAIAAGHESGTDAPVLAFTLPAAARNADLEHVTITWKNLASGASGSETIAIGDPKLTTAPVADPLSGVSGTKRYYTPSGAAAGYPYYFTVTLLDGRGQASEKANAITDTVTTTLTVATDGGSGTGTVSLSPAGGSYDYGTEVTLTPAGSGGSRLYGWTGADGEDAADNGDGTYTIVMEGDKSVSADFRKVLVAAGYEHTLFAVEGGGVWAAGNNESSILGDGTTTTRLTPVPIAGLADIAGIAAGYRHSMAFTADGRAYSWGANAYGSLGIGSASNIVRSTPSAIASLSGVVSLIAAEYSSLALLPGGAVYVWGWGLFGQLGNGSFGSSVYTGTPTAVSALTSGAEAISSRMHHCLALKAGAVYAWGRNHRGQLGDGTVNDAATPMAVSGLPNGIVAVSAGLGFSLAHAADGTVWAWGDNNAGMLGNGTTTTEPTPIQVPGFSAVAIRAGLNHSLALKSDGTVWAWGGGAYGQIGNGGTADSHVPVQVSGLPDIVAIEAGNYCNFAVAEDGAVYAWGRNNYGQLGDGTTTDQKAPVKVSW